MIAPALICLAQIIFNGQQTQPVSNGPKHTVTGTVSNAITGEPIRKALVQLGGLTQTSGLTGSDGRFRFDEIPEGQVYLLAQKPGYFDQRSLEQSQGMVVSNDFGSFKVDSGKNDFALKLYPSARIVGHVTDGNGDPVESGLNVLREQMEQGRKQWQQQQVAKSDDDGGFRIEGLAPGRYIVFCQGHEVPPTSLNGPRAVEPPMYYPDAKDNTSAQAIDLQAGQEFIADFHLKAERGYRVSGQILDASGNAGTNVVITTEDGQMIPNGAMHFDGKRGQFSAEGIPSGTWAVVVQGADKGGRFYQTRAELTVDHADVTGLQIQAQPNANIPVTVNHTGKQQEGQQPNQINVQVMLAGSGSSRQNNYGAFPQGDPPVMQFMNIPAGKYRLSVHSFGNECVESAMYGNVDLARDEMAVSGGAGAQPIVLTMTTECATLKLTAKTAAMYTFAILIPSTAFGEPIVQPIMSTSQQQITLAPGTYQVFAFSNMAGLEYGNPEVMRAYPSQSITLDAGQQKELTVDVLERKDR